MMMESSVFTHDALLPPVLVMMFISVIPGEGIL